MYATHKPQQRMSNAEAERIADIKPKRASTVSAHLFNESNQNSPDAEPSNPASAKTLRLSNGSDIALPLKEAYAESYRSAITQNVGRPIVSYADLPEKEALSLRNKLQRCKVH